MRKPVAGKVGGRKGEQGKAKRGKAAGSKPEQRSAVGQRAAPAKGGPCPDVHGEAEPDAMRADVAADKTRGPAGGAMGKAVQGRSVKGKAARAAAKVAPQKRAVEPAAGGPEAGEARAPGGEAIEADSGGCGGLPAACNDGRGGKRQRGDGGGHRRGGTW